MTHLKPCLVIGSGFHRWVLGKSSTPLTDWHTLIDETASKMRVAVPSRLMPPLLRWEKLIQLATKEGYLYGSGQTWVEENQNQPFKVESDAKKVVCAILDEKMGEYPSRSVRSKFPLNETWGSVISLNFDHCWMGALGFGFSEPDKPDNYKAMSHSEFSRLHLRMFPLNKPDSRIWFPNGVTKKPVTIRMGLHDYGAKPQSIKQVFRKLKAFERTTYKKSGGNDWFKYREELEAAMNSDALPVATWVSDFLYRPLYFAGVGLSEAETGLWWLLVQRSRNFSRLDIKSVPPTVALVDAKAENRAFWESRPCDVEPIFCDNWDIGWDVIVGRAKDQVIDGGIF
jgi:hypothetical protein